MNLRFELFVNNLKESANFYTNVLGFQTGYSSSDYIDVHCGQVAIGLCPMEKLQETHPLKAKQEERRGLGVEIVFDVENVDDFYQQVISTSYESITPLKAQPWNLRDFRLIDPDGYYIRITGK